MCSYVLSKRHPPYGPYATQPRGQTPVFVLVQWVAHADVRRERRRVTVGGVSRALPGREDCRTKRRVCASMPSATARAPRNLMEVHATRRQHGPTPPPQSCVMYTVLFELRDA